MKFFILTFFLITIQSSLSAIQPPELKWRDAGCQFWGCDLGWQSSPVYQKGVIYAASYSIWAINASTGKLIWSFKTGNDINSPTNSTTTFGYTWAGLVLVENFQGQTAIITSHSKGMVAAYSINGQFLSGWPVNVTQGKRELRSLIVQRLSLSSPYIVIVGSSGDYANNTWAFDEYGQLLSGFPTGPPGLTLGVGVQADNQALGDLNGDGILEIITPCDSTQIGAQHQNGSAVNSQIKNWQNIPSTESIKWENKGWAPCNEADTRFVGFTSGICSTFQQNFSTKVACVGNTWNCYQSTNTVQESMFIFNGNRSRFVDPNKNYNWTTIANFGKAITEDLLIILPSIPKIAIGDLDNDGELEFVFPTQNGKMNAIKMNQKSFGNWPYSFYVESINFTFASEPIIVDIDGDQNCEVIFTTWTKYGSNEWGFLYILSFEGNLLKKISLPKSKNRDYGGGCATPTIFVNETTKNINIIINTISAGVVLQEIPNSNSAKNFQWITGRGNQNRDGMFNSAQLNNIPRWGIGLVLGIIVPFVLLIISALLFYYWKRKRLEKNALNLK